MRLELMAEHQIPADKIARKLRRSEAAVRAEARKQHVMLAPAEKQLAFTDKRPYGGLQLQQPVVQKAARVEPRRSLAKASAPGRPSRSRPERPQTETLF